MKVLQSTKNMFNNWIFTSKIMNALPTEPRDRLNKLKKTALAVALIDGLLFGAAMNAILDVPFIPCTLGMMVAVLLIESFFLSPDASGKGMWIVRFVIAAIMVGCHSLILDSWVLNQDIENHFAEINQQKSAQIDSLYLQKEQAITLQINDLQAKNDSLEAIQNKWSERVFAEINVGSGQREKGYGIVARKYESLGQKDTERVAPLIQANQASIDTLRADISALRNEKAEQKANLIVPSDRGLMERIEAVAVLVFSQGNHHAILAYALMFLLMLTLELLPLMQKIKSESAYQLYSDEVIKQSREELDKQLRASSFERIMDEKLEEHKARLDLEASLKAQEHHHLQKMQEMELTHDATLEENQARHDDEKKQQGIRNATVNVPDFTEAEKRGPGRPRKE